MPKRLVCSAQAEVSWMDYEDRIPTGTEIRIQFEFGVEKHGTMMAFFKGYANDRGRWDADWLLHRAEGMLWNYPIPLGNTQIGHVSEIGPETKSVQVGDKVSIETGFRPSLVTDEANVFSWPEETPWQDIGMLDPSEYAFGALRDGGVRIGDRIAIFGLGAIGLALVQLAKTAGATQVIAIDPIASRRKIALQLGATHELSPIGEDIGLQLKTLTDKRGPDVIIDFSGSPQALQAALRGIAYNGTIVCGAFPPPHSSGLDFGAEAHMNRPKIIFTRACSDPNPEHPRWDHNRIQKECRHLISQGHVRGGLIVGPVILFEDLLSVYPQIATDPGAHLKLAVKY